MLIDVNEEIFEISEELAGAFQMTMSEQNSKILLRKAQEFEVNKHELLQKIRLSITNNPSVVLVKSDLDLSPPEKESRVMQMIKEYSNSKERVPEKSPVHKQGPSSTSEYMMY